MLSDAPPEIRELGHLDSVLWTYWMIELYTNKGAPVPPYLSCDDMLSDTPDKHRKRKFMNRCFYSKVVGVDKDTYDIGV